MNARSNISALTTLVILAMIVGSPLARGEDITAVGFHPSKLEGNDRIPVLLVTGQMNPYHDWEGTTVIMKDVLEASGHFTVDVAVSPEKGEDLSMWDPKFEAYPVVLLNSDGDMWPEPLRRRFEAYMAGGGGMVSVHSSDNAFTAWPAFNEMIAVGGWNDRDENSGSYIRWRDGKMVVENIRGPSGSHGPRHEFVITFREVDPVIGKGLPAEWKHAEDELYDRLRGPAKNVEVVASAFSDEEYEGSNEHEPMLMTIRYGKGRIFHTTLGHDVPAMQCVGFQFTLMRGLEWAAIGKVTLPPPSDFPSADQVRVRE